MPRIAHATTVLRAIYRETRAENVTFMAGSIAYHAFVSLLPFLLVLLLVVTAVGGPDLATRVVTATGAYLSPNATELLTDVVVRATRNAGVSLLGGATLVWGTLKIFRSLDQAFSDIYETEELNTLGDQLFDAVTVLVAMGLAIALVAAVGRLVPDGLGPAGGAVSFALVVGALALAFLPVYYVFPDEEVTVREVLPGTLLAAVGWATLESLFQHYVAVAGKSDTYGVLGAILVLITWLYFSGLVVLLGAVVNAVLAGRSEDVADIDWADPTGGFVAAGGDGTASGTAPETAPEHPAASGADFTDPLRELRTALDAGESVTVRTAGREVTLPPPGEREVTVETVSRPAILGGSHERGVLRLAWVADASPETGPDSGGDRDPDAEGDRNPDAG